MPTDPDVDAAASPSRATGPGELEALRAALVARWRPQDAAEAHWVEELVFTAWRQQQLRVLEAAVLARALAGGPEADAPALPSLATVIRYRSRLDRDWRRAGEALDELRRARERLLPLARTHTAAELLAQAARIGADAVWDKAEHALMESLRASGCEFEIAPGDGAFYGPKIEYTLKDALGREWQVGTMQVDPNLPERLDAEYVAEDGTRKRPMMLHRATVGSMERFIGLLIEHHAGAMPTWLAPVQVVAGLPDGKLPKAA